MKFASLAATVFLTLPAFAGLAGRWDVTTTNNDGEKMKAVLTVTESGGSSTAALAVGDQKIPLENVAVTADQISFRLMWGSTGVNVKAKLDGEKLAGAWTADSGETGSVGAVRAAAPPSPTAFFTGKWKLTVNRPDRDPLKAEMDVKDEAGALSTTLLAPDGMTIPCKTSLEGGTLTVAVDAGSATYTLKFERDGDGMKGVATGPNGNLPVAAAR